MRLPLMGETQKEHRNRKGIVLAGGSQLSQFQDTIGSEDPLSFSSSGKSLQNPFYLYPDTP